MSGPEAAFWSLVNPHLPAGHKERVENVVAVGTPDVNCCFQGIEYWIELKAAKARRYNLEKLFEPGQPIWHYKRVKAGGTVLVMVKGPRLIDVYKAVIVKNRVTPSYLRLYRMIPPYDWERLTTVLTMYLQGRR